MLPKLGRADAHLLWLSQMLADQRHQLIVVEGLLDVRPSSSRQSALLVSVQIAGRHDDDGNDRKVCVRAVPIENQEAVARWKTQIQNDQVRLMLARLAHSRRLVRRKVGIVAVRFEKDVIPETHIGIILDDKNLLATHDEPRL